MSGILVFGPAQFSTINHATKDKESKVIKCENKKDPYILKVNKHTYILIQRLHF